VTENRDAGCHTDGFATAWQPAPTRKENRMATSRVFIVMPSWEDERTTHNLRPAKGSWGTIIDIVRGERPASDYKKLDLVIDVPNPSDWDFHDCGGTLGLLSRRFVDAFHDSLSRCFEPLEARINGLPFFFLRVKASIDCLDRAQSVIIPFVCDPTAIKRIERYRFAKDVIPDPALFVIPEGLTHLFGSHSIPDLIAKYRLRGIETIDTEDPPSWLNY
jgi:hypothetical protein